MTWLVGNDWVNCTAYSYLGFVFVCLWCWRGLAFLREKFGFLSQVHANSLDGKIASNTEQCHVRLALRGDGEIGLWSAQAKFSDWAVEWLRCLCSHAIKTKYALTSEEHFLDACSFFFRNSLAIPMAVTLVHWTNAHVFIGGQLNKQNNEECAHARMHTDHTRTHARTHTHTHTQINTYWSHTVYNCELKHDS